MRKAPSAASNTETTQLAKIFEHSLVTLGRCGAPARSPPAGASEPQHKPVGREAVCADWNRAAFLSHGLKRRALPAAYSPIEALSHCKFFGGIFPAMKGVKAGSGKKPAGLL